MFQEKELSPDIGRTSDEGEEFADEGGQHQKLEEQITHARLIKLQVLKGKCYQGCKIALKCSDPHRVVTYFHF